jgi:hypothetical protein
MTWLKRPPPSPPEKPPPPPPPEHITLSDYFKNFEAYLPVESLPSISNKSLWSKWCMVQNIASLAKLAGCRKESCFLVAFQEVQHRVSSKYGAKSKIKVILKILYLHMTVHRKLDTHL